MVIPVEAVQDGYLPAGSDTFKVWYGAVVRSAKSCLQVDMALRLGQMTLVRDTV